MSSSSLVLAKSTPLPAKLHDGRRDGRDARNIWILGEEFGNFGRGDKTLPSSSAFSSAAAQDEKMEFFGPKEEEEEAAPTYNSPNNEARQHFRRLGRVKRKCLDFFWPESNTDTQYTHLITRATPSSN